MNYSYKKSLNIIKKKKIYNFYKKSKFIIFIKIIDQKTYIKLKKELIKINLKFFFLKKKLIENSNIYIKNQNSLYSIHVNNEKIMYIIYEFLIKNNINILFISNTKNIYSNLKLEKKYKLKKKKDFLFNLKLFYLKIILILNKKNEFLKADIT